MFEEYQNLKLKSIDIISSYSQYKLETEFSYRQVSDLELDIQKSLSLQSIQENSIEVVKELIDKLSKGHINLVQDMITFALSMIFHDKEYRVEIEVDSTKVDKTAEFFLIEKFTNGTERKVSFYDSIGGGILASVGLVCQIFYILYYKCEPILLMDEALSQLSDKYIRGLFDFLKFISKEKGFKFLLITHDCRIVSLADTCYLVENGYITDVSGTILDIESFDKEDY